ncbi:hypothetical protein [Sneathiella limimaris]|uniref:hypothetical protein n=1 Tax=Sneathiella limimaris TaxID=1964213 RepID=UPI00146E87D4|nr:hypothetical protein [Sneathiella limimaris]
MTVNSSQQYELPKWLWVWVVLLPLTAQLIVRGFWPDFARDYFSGEGGIVENVTVVILIPTILLAIYLVLNRASLPVRWMTYWYALLGLACLYFAGEEASWGQHWFGWETPEFMGELNDQGETNLHNMSSWLDQKPRLIVELSALIGGVILPIWRARKGIQFVKGSWQDLFWPTWICLPVSVIVGFIKIPDRVFGSTNIPYPFNLNVSETQELYVALAFFIYLLSVTVRVKRLAN